MGFGIFGAAETIRQPLSVEFSPDLYASARGANCRDGCPALQFARDSDRSFLMWLLSLDPMFRAFYRGIRKAVFSRTDTVSSSKALTSI